MAEAETNTTAEETTAAENTHTDGAKTYTPPATQADLDHIIESRLARERAKYEGFDDFKAKAAKYDQQVEASKSEQQKLAERAEAAEAERDEVTARMLRFEVAAEKGLTPKQAARLQGATKEELLADADELLAEFKPAAPQASSHISATGATPEITSKDAQARAFFGI